MKSTKPACRNASTGRNQVLQT